jgi:hypothetical protein
MHDHKVQNLPGIHSAKCKKPGEQVVATALHSLRKQRLIVIERPLR